MQWLPDLRRGEIISPRASACRALGAGTNHAGLFELSLATRLSPSRSIALRATEPKWGLGPSGDDRFRDSHLRIAVPREHQCNSSHHSTQNSGSENDHYRAVYPNI
jgi:hypothetical protein